MTASPAMVSVLVPAFNAARTLPRALDSLLAQTLQSFEVLVVDDGSRDATEAVVRPYLNDSRFHYWRQDNQGVAATRNAAALQARGTYLAFLDADDWLEPRALATLVAHFEQSAADWANVALLRVDGDRREVHCALRPAGDPLLAILADDFVTRCCFVRRSAFLAVGMFDPQLRGREDWDLNIRLIAGGHPWICVNEPLYHYTRTDGSLTVGARQGTMLSCTERLLAKHHLALARGGSQAASRLYAENMWALGRVYWYEYHSLRDAARCAWRSLRQDFSLHRLVHPLLDRLRPGAVRN